MCLISLSMFEAAFESNLHLSYIKPGQVKNTTKLKMIIKKKTTTDYYIGQ